MNGKKAVLICLFGIGSGGAHAYAQLAIPPIQASDASIHPLSAAEAVYHVAIKEARLNAAVSFRQAYYPSDSLQQVVRETAKRWLADLSVHSVHGMQLDPLGHISVAASEESYANAQISARVATPGLSFGDKAFTYLVAIQAFTSTHYPERLSTAEGYLRQLDAMGNAAASWQFEARRSLMQVYYQLGRSADVVRLGTRAFELAGVMPFVDRILMFPPAEDYIYTMTIEALTGQPNARQRINTLNTLLRAATVPPPTVVAFDSAFVKMEHDYQDRLSQFIAVGALLGTTAYPVVSNYWLNRSSRDSAMIAMNDGKIRVLEVGSYTCAPCLVALQAMQRLQQRFPTIQAMMLTWTTGFWANRLVDADEEAKDLAEYYLNTARVTIPIAIWKGKKVRNEDGGITPENAGPNYEHYPMLSKPMTWIVDGKGTIRRVFLGYTRDTEVQMAQTIAFLQQESAANSATNQH